MPQKIVAVLLVAMLLLAGCATSTSPSTSSPTATPTDTQTPTHTTIATTTETPTATPTSTQASRRDETVDPERAIQSGKLAENSHPITADTQRVMSGLLQDFYRELPTNETQRKAETVQAARTLCTESQPIDPTVFEASDKFDRQSYRLYHATNTINEHFNKEISTKKLQNRMSDAGSISKYTPLLGSYNRMYETACAVDPEDEESIEAFYIATASFGVETALVQQQVFFKSSFAATRYTTNKLSLMKVRTVTGDKGYGFLMSEIHWAYRGSQASAVSYVFSKSADLGNDVSEMERGPIRDAANKQYEDYRENATRSIDSGKDTVENKTKIMEECAAASKTEESGSFWDRASNKVSEISDGLKSGLQNVSSVKASDIPSHVNESIDQPREFTSCMNERLGE